MPKVVQDAGPVALVVSRNLKRRHLTPTQRAAIAADALPLFEEEASKRRAAGKKADETSAPDGAQAGGRAAAQAAAATGSSTRSVQRAKKQKQRDPKAFEDAKAGKTTLGAALRDKKAEAKAAKAAKAAARGLETNDSLAKLFLKASSAGGKLTVVIGWWQVKVTKLKEKKAAKTKAGAQKLKRFGKAKAKRGRPRKK
jgi:hypothetical protein